CVIEAANRMSQRMDNAKHGIGKGHSGMETGPRQILHVFRSPFVNSVCQTVCQKTQRLYGMDIGEGRRGYGKESFHGMAEGIGSSGTDKFIRQCSQCVRVCQADIRSNTAAHDADFSKVLGVADDCKLGNIGTGAAGRRTENQRRKWSNNPVRSFKVADFSSVGDKNGDCLGRIHGAAAPEADNHVGAVTQILSYARVNFVILWIRRNSVKINEFKSSLKKASHGLINPAGMKQPLVADKKYLLAAKSAGARPHLIQHASAENYFRHLKFIIMQSVILMFFHFLPFVAYQQLAITADIVASA